MRCATLIHSKEQTRTLITIVSRMIPDRRMYLLQDLLFRRVQRWVLIFLFVRLGIATQLIVQGISWKNQAQVSYLMDDSSEHTSWSSGGTHTHKHYQFQNWKSLIRMICRIR